jgi:hypothetical protein
VTALRTHPLTATHAPLGSTAARNYDQAAERAVEAVRLWPGITWGRDSRCLCSWASRHGVMQVKVRSGACTMHLASRKPGIPPRAGAKAAVAVSSSPAPVDALLAACRSGTVTQALYDASVEDWHAERGTLPPEAALRRIIAALRDLLLGDGFTADRAAA